MSNPSQKELDATKRSEFIDWKFEEWLDSRSGEESGFLNNREAISHSIEEIRTGFGNGDGMTWLRAAFHAGAKR